MNNKTKFTPAPWVKGSDNIKDADDYGIDCSQDCGWSYVGTHNKCTAIIVTKSYSDTEMDANTNLIAAAPEMYDLLATIENDANQLPAWLWDKIQTTLAEARGEIND